jgi:hypothetical protein
MIEAAEAKARIQLANNLQGTKVTKRKTAPGTKEQEPMKKAKQEHPEKNVCRSWKTTGECPHKMRCQWLHPVKYADTAQINAVQVQKGHPYQIPTRKEVPLQHERVQGNPQLLGLPKPK